MYKHKSDFKNEEIFYRVRNISEYFYEKRLTTLWIMTLNFLSLKKNREVHFHKQGKAGRVAYNSAL